ncbi:MAG: sugar nucleotide-binding protein [Pseudomonadota bacterium]
MSTPDRILVTGGGGRLGRALRSIGCKAYARSELDITNPKSVSRALDHAGPAIVINAAAYTNVEAAETDRSGAFAVNAEGAGHVANACAERDIPLIHISTDYVFGDGDPAQPISPAATPAPLSIYGESKHAGEQAVQSAGGQSTIVRVSWLYDGGESTFIDKMLKIAATRDALTIVDDAMGRPSHVADLAPCLVTLANLVLERQAGLPEILHMGPREPASRYDWAVRLFEVSAELGGPSPSLTRCTSDAFPTKVRHPLGLVLEVGETEPLLGQMPSWHKATRVAVTQRLANAAEV